MKRVSVAAGEGSEWSARAVMIDLIRIPPTPAEDFSESDSSAVIIQLLTLIDIFQTGSAREPETMGNGAVP